MTKLMVLFTALLFTPVAALPEEGPAAGAPAAAHEPDPEPLARPRVSRHPVITVAASTDEQRGDLDQALDRFRRAGLDLPVLDVSFSDDEADCNGNNGLFQRRHTPWRIVVCSRMPLVITHELAHAWIESHLDDEARSAYAEARGLEVWDDQSVEWHDRAAEDAAFVIQINLDTNNPRVDEPRWRERTAAYELLTGSPSPVLEPGPQVQLSRRW